MKTNSKFLGIALIVAVAVAGALIWFNGALGPRSLKAYSQVRGNMTVEDVRKVMGREEDSRDLRKTNTGEFELSWTFEDGARYTVVFNNEGRSTYKEIAPHYCGVTPLQDKYIEDRKD